MIGTFPNFLRNKSSNVHSCGMSPFSSFSIIITSSSSSHHHEHHLFFCFFISSASAFYKLLMFIVTIIIVISSSSLSIVLVLSNLVLSWIYISLFWSLLILYFCTLFIDWRFVGQITLFSSSSDNFLISKWNHWRRNLKKDVSPGSHPGHSASRRATNLQRVLLESRLLRALQNNFHEENFFYRGDLQGTFERYFSEPLRNLPGRNGLRGTCTPYNRLTSLTSL